ncbi:hypothetical protein KIN20_014147 [Parelaphostrongylus tenuis]|uniref:Uncharacterized protein n=1 Tax=Parelaphostrongylus tenuis TaxID=148309 RepID=A0AAD5QLG7_PARTN|nr:hypothetical protein KIN20_014147 [Parelaphostrongylus tenuis]
MAARINYRRHIEKDRIEDYGLFVDGLKRCAELDSATQSNRSDRTSSTNKDLPEKKSKLMPDADGSHLVRSIRNDNCRKALKKDLHRHMIKKLLEARKRSSLEDGRQDLCEYSVMLSTLMKEVEIKKTSRHGRELITGKFCEFESRLTRNLCTSLYITWSVQFEIVFVSETA